MATEFVNDNKITDNNSRNKQTFIQSTFLFCSVYLKWILINIFTLWTKNKQVTAAIVNNVINCTGDSQNEICTCFVEKQFSKGLQTQIE